MAESEANQPDLAQENEEKLNYLEFVQSASIYAAICLSSVYEYAKENSGPLKLGVQTVEGTVKTVIGPVYEKFHDVPFEFLKFVDRKVDKSITEVERHVPSLLKNVSSQAFTAAQKAPELARAVMSEIQRDGVVDATKNITKNVYSKYEPTAKELYSKYEPVAEHYAVSAWRTLNRLPLFPQVSELVIPTAAHWSDRYNRTVSYMAEKHYAPAMYLPLIPKDRIAKIFEEDPTPSVSTNAEEISEAQS
ncbi:stress-related protein [Senna tora]|uniref:Stress-related protein n=1 Tax=Senna tora TaxID=362788 RepID=A0A834SPR1_9FABA|nr:stress-related protein [Senna tora]